MDDTECPRLHGCHLRRRPRKVPKLRIALLEAGVGWAGYWLDRMDGHYEKMGSMAPWLKKRPTEYFMEQCYLSLDPDERTLGAMCDLGLDRNIMWDSDFPHFDCIYPGVVKQVEEAVEDSTRDGASQHHDREPGAISSHR